MASAISKRSSPVMNRNAHCAQPVHIEQLDQTPDLLRLHALAPERYPFLLESAGDNTATGRFDILFAFPGETLMLDASRHLEGRGTPNNDFLHALDHWWSDLQPVSDPPPGLPFHGGWFVFLAYELAQQVEPRLALDADPSWPLAMAVRVPAAIVHDRATGRSMAVAETDRAELLRQIQADLAALRSREGWRPAPAGLVCADSIREEDPGLFLQAAERARQYISAGDIYQANISRRWRAGVGPDTASWMLYERLRRANPGPFSGLAVFGNQAIISSSPERLLRVKAGRVETRPIAGTRPRDPARRPDEAHRSELLASAKERAEHVMLIDLERNDLGRICRAGSVRVDEFMTVESYAHVHHIVSNVSGDLRPGIRPGEVLRAIFPGGTITGCPKVRCMSIIRELEGRPRGVYCGSMGYLNRDGSCDFNILIRTMTLVGSELALDAGSGVVADSVPEKELEETRAKAKGMLLSLSEECRSGAQLAR